MSRTSLLAKIVEYGSTGFSPAQLERINSLYKKIDPSTKGFTDENRKQTAALASDIFISPKIKNLLLISAGLCLDVFYFKELHILMILFMEYVFSAMIKTLIGGIHLKRKVCTLFSLVMYLGGYVFAVYSGIGFYGRLLLFSLCFILLALYAPRDTKNAIVNIEAKKKRRNKTLNLISLVFVIFMVLPFSEVYKNIIVWVIAVQTATILPFVFNKIERREN